jgi:hypothetical protein
MFRPFLIAVTSEEDIEDRHFLLGSRRQPPPPPIATLQQLQQQHQQQHQPRVFAAAQASPASTTTLVYKDKISVRFCLILGGYLACIVSAIFSIVLVLLTPGPIDPTSHSLRYISQGMFDHCGLATSVLGTCCLLLFACQIIAAMHMEHASAIFCAVMQAAAWNVVLGVADTGWVVHYFGLGVFLLTTVIYHWCASNDKAYGGPVYRAVTYIALVIMFIFCVLVVVAMVMRGSSPTPQTVAVAVEFAMMIAISAENMCLVNALDQFEDIHLQFCARKLQQQV